MDRPRDPAPVHRLHPLQRQRQLFLHLQGKGYNLQIQRKWLGKAAAPPQKKSFFSGRTTKGGGREFWVDH